jgi:hypothetical protein
MSLIFSETRPRIPYKGPYRKADFNGPLFIWSKADQFEAVKRGYFIERALKDNHAVVLPLITNPRTDTGIMRDAARRVRASADPHAIKLCQFVQQQDEYLWPGMWETVTIETCLSRDASKMRWFKAYAEANDPDRNPELKRNLGGRPPGPTGYAMPRYIRSQPDTVKGMARAREADLKRRLRNKYGAEALTPEERAQNRIAGATKRSEIAREKRESIAYAADQYRAMALEEWHAENIQMPFETWVKKGKPRRVKHTDPT